ncbi:MAG TPA: Gfo/Idh/MocA family oxidoreductase [Candidatus Sulfotelmatobacter sp.]|jgi:predicted dehydrogenase
MTIRVGLIGGGNISETHARAAKAIFGVEIAAVCVANPEKASRLTRAFGGKVYTDFETFLKHKPLDLVMIGTPSGMHATHGIAAARQGLHVLTEKPIDISTERADQLIAAAEQAGVKLGVIFQDRFKPDIRRFKRWIDDGAIGQPLIVDARVKWYRPPNYYSASKWRGTIALDGGGALINQAIHTVDLLLWLFGEVTHVQSQIGTKFHAIESEDTAMALLHFASGAIGTFVASTAIFPGYPRRIEATGTNGTLILEHDEIVAADLRDVPSKIRLSVPSPRKENVASPVVSDFSGHQAVLEDFIHAIEDDRQPECHGLEGRKSLALVEEIYRASRNRDL